ncbi:RPM1-interacting protein 4 (RIN4) family protein [Citrus sinensis]|nr:RPM1-interacting protein 4 (RIN4) family protein [Citrus sinensis]
MAEKGGPLPKFGEWDVNDPASAEGFTVIFNKARNEKKTGGKPDSPVKDDSQFKHGAVLGKPQSVVMKDEYMKKNGFAACKLPVQNHRKLLSFKSFARKASYIYVQPRCKIRKTGAYQKL